MLRDHREGQSKLERLSREAGRARNPDPGAMAVDRAIVTAIEAWGTERFWKQSLAMADAVIAWAKGDGACLTPNG